MSKLLWLLFFNSYIFIFLSLFFFGGGATAQQVGSQFSAQGSNPRPLHWKLEFQPLDHKQSPKTAVALIPGSGGPAGEGIGYPLLYYLASLVAQLVQNLPAMRETWDQSLGWKIPWRGERLPTLVSWPGELHGLYSPWGCKESNTTNFYFTSYK